MRVLSIKSLGLLFTALMFSGCGGGGGAVGGTAAGTYTGVATQATVTTSNAVALSADAYQNGSIGSTVSIARLATQNESPVVRASILPDVGSLLRSGITKGIQAQAVTRTVLPGVAVSNTVNGAFGGSASFSLDVDPTTGAVSGTETFSDYKDSATGPSLFGTVAFSGLFNQSSGTFNSLEIAFAPLAAITTNGTFTLYGSIAFATGATAETLNVSCTLKRSSDASYCWIKDWSFTFNSGNLLTITGRYYDPLHGYVDISTPVPLTVSSPGGRAISGIWHSAGANGTRAKLTFTAIGFTVEADVAGSGQWLPIP